MEEKTKAKAAESNVVKNDKGLIYKPDENKLVVTGTLTAFRFSKTKYSGDKEYYQVSVKTESLTPEVVEAIVARYFADTKDKYLPSFVKEVRENGCKEPIYVNLKSQYEIPTFIDGEGNRRYSCDDVIELGEGLAPIGSDVKLSIRLKGNKEDETSGAYPLGVLITKLQKQDASDYFD